MTSRVTANDGPPEGVKSTGIQVLVDADQKTAVILQFFESAEDMRDAEQVFDSMDPGETPGTRHSVDRTERKLDLHA